MTQVSALAPETWRHFVMQHPHGTLLQTQEWGQLKADFGWDWKLVSVNPAAPEAGALLLIRRWLLSRLATIAYVPRGPVVTWTDSALTQAVISATEAAARRQHALALWLEPELEDTPAHRALLERLGYLPVSHTIQPPRTLIVDLHGEEAAILTQMKQKTRYNIRLAERKGVTVRQGTLADLPTFYALLQQTGKRDAFGIHTAAYYRRAFEIFAPLNQVALLIAEVEGEAVAALMVFALGQKAWYFYGASSDLHREKMPTYALQWAAMRWAKAHGCTSYDLWGIPDADEATLEAEFASRSDGLWGVYRFKRGFGGRVVRFVGLWEKPLHPLYPPLIRALRRLNRRETANHHPTTRVTLL